MDTAGSGVVHTSDDPGPVVTPDGNNRGRFAPGRPKRIDGRYALDVQGRMIHPLGEKFIHRKVHLQRSIPQQETVAVQSGLLQRLKVLDRNLRKGNKLASSEFCFSCAHTNRFFVHEKVQPRTEAGQVRGAIGLNRLPRIVGCRETTNDWIVLGQHFDGHVSAAVGQGELGCIAGYFTPILTDRTALQIGQPYLTHELVAQVIIGQYHPVDREGFHLGVQQRDVPVRKVRMQ